MLLMEVCVHHHLQDTAAQLAFYIFLYMTVHIYRPAMVTNNFINSVF